MFYYQLYFAGSGSLAGSDDTDKSAATSLAAAPPISSGMTFKIGGNAVNGVEDWVLDFPMKMPPPIWPSEYLGWPRRDSGNWEATLAWTQYFDDKDQLTNMLDAGSIFKQYQPYVTASTYWDIKWMKLLRRPTFYPIDAGAGRPNYVTARLQAAFSGFDDTATPVKGAIVNPALSTLWPT